ncbi:MAG: hypothetical protein ACYC8T_12635, partial [Myxococcaceae bacterium]
LIAEQVRSRLSSMREAFLAEHRGADVAAFYKEVPPFFHDAWVGSILEPVVPTLHNTDGEEMTISQVTFEVVDAQAMAAALDGAEGFERSGEAAWSWSGKSAREALVVLGTLQHREASLLLETNSVRRAERGRSLLESLAAGAVRHRSTTHQDMARLVKERVKSGKGKDLPRQEPANQLPPGVAEALALNHYARHYRAWVDEAIPALEGKTPREAAKEPALREKLADLIRGLEGMYQGQLEAGAPAYDPSWMWRELGFEEHSAPTHPPPLAHERLAALHPGSAELCRTVAEQLRRAPGFEDASTVVTDQAFRENLDVQRYLRGAVAGEPGRLERHLRLMLDFDLHRRKAFWVDESLAYLLDHSDLDVVGRELRVPFASFALVFTDRHVLSLAERMLAAGPECPLSGQLLRVATVYVTEQHAGEDRSLELCFALDALGADPPHLVRHALPLKEEGKVEAYLDAVAPQVAVEPAVPDTDPVRGLIRVAINAILYATSAGVEPQVRPGAKKGARGPRSRHGPATTYSSDEVYFLPGAIEISQLRRMQELERVPDGRSILRRFMVRGHWRRAAASWEDQRMRWVQPYWKGPDLAAIIERTYKLKP